MLTNYTEDTKRYNHLLETGSKNSPRIIERDHRRMVELLRHSWNWKQSIENITQEKNRTEHKSQDSTIYGLFRYAVFAAGASKLTRRDGP
jgi:hypothetical protein